MAKATDLVRTARLEVVDRKGRTRVVIGTLADGDRDTIGVSVLDSHGLERLFLNTDETTASAGLTNGENNVAGVSVSDDGAVWVFVADRDGDVLASWSGDGT